MRTGLLCGNCFEGTEKQLEGTVVLPSLSLAARLRRIWSSSERNQTRPCKINSKIKVMIIREGGLLNRRHGDDLGIKGMGSMESNLDSYLMVLRCDFN